LKRGTLADRAIDERPTAHRTGTGLAKRQVGCVDDVITAWRVQGRLGRNEHELAEVICEEGTPRL